MNEDEKRLQLQREEMIRQAAREEMNRQMQRDEMNRHEAQRLQEAEVRKKEAANRCVNNDNPAAIGGLCVACYAAMRAAEASTARPFDKTMIAEIVRDVDKMTTQIRREHVETLGVPVARGERPPPGASQVEDDDAALAAKYARNFDKIPAVLRLWEQAVAAVGAEDAAFERVRQQFWRIVNSDKAPDAAYVRQLLKAAGFQLGKGDNAPMLRARWVDARTGRYENARRLSVDHEVPKSKDADRAVDASNLRFMLMDDWA